MYGLFFVVHHSLLVAMFCFFNCGLQDSGTLWILLFSMSLEAVPDAVAIYLVPVEKRIAYKRRLSVGKVDLILANCCFFGLCSPSQTS